MKTYHVDGRKGVYDVTLPTDISEITAEYLLNVSADVEVAPNWSLIALVYRANVNELLTSMRQKKNTAIPLVPLFIKTRLPEDNKNAFLNRVVAGTPLVVSTSELTMGNHVNCKYNDLSIDKVIPILETDPSVTKETLISKIQHFFVDFKIVPNSIIHGIINKGSRVDIRKLPPIIVRPTDTMAS